MRKRVWAVMVLVGVSACSDVPAPTESVEPISQPLLQKLEASTPTLKSDSPDTSGVGPLVTSAGVLPDTATGTVVTSAGVLPDTATGTVVTSAAVSREVEMSEMIAFFRRGPNRQKFAGLVQVLEVGNGYGQPGHQQRVRALPVHVERGRVESRGGRQGMVKRYVHRSGHTREVFWPLEPTNISSPVPAPEAEILLLAEDGDGVGGPRVLGDSGSMDWSEVGGQSGREWCEHIDPEDGDLSSECASEQEVDDFFSYMVTTEAELGAAENDINYEIGLICDAMSQLSYPPQEYYEYCAATQASGAADPFSAGPATERMSGPFYDGESSDILPAPRLMSTAAADCENLVGSERATCLGAAISAVWGLGVTIFGVGATADKAMTWYLSKGYRIAGRAVLAYAGATAVGAGVAIYGAYAFYQCMND